MLGTPPAFVLSQDQTLKKLYLNNLSVAQIIFQVICSSKFYSRIFVGLNSIFTRNLNNSLLSKVFLVRLHVIQFTRYRRCSRKLSLAANLYILAEPSAFVKNFFHFFSNFFSIRFLSCRSATTFTYYHHTIVLSRGNFSFYIAISTIFNFSPTKSG